MPHYEPVGRKPFTTPPGSRTTSRKNSMHDATRPSFATDSAVEVPPLPDLLAETIKNLKDTEVERGRQREARQLDPDAPVDRPNPLWEDGSRAGRRGRSVTTRDKVAMWEERSRSRSMGRSKSRRRYLDDPNRVSIVPEIPDLELALEKAQESHREVQNSPLAGTRSAQVAEPVLPSSPGRGPASPVEESQHTPTQAEFSMPSTPVHAERIAQATTPPPESPTGKIPPETLQDEKPVSMESRADTPPPVDAAPTDSPESLESISFNTPPTTVELEDSPAEERIKTKDLPAATEAVEEPSKYTRPTQDEPVEHLENTEEPIGYTAIEELTQAEPAPEEVASALEVAAEPMQLEDQPEFSASAQDEAVEEPVLTQEPSEFVAQVHEEAREEPVFDERLSEQISPVQEIDAEELGVVPDEMVEQLPYASEPSEPPAEPSEPAGEPAEDVTPLQDATTVEVLPAEELPRHQTLIQEATPEEMGLDREPPESIVSAQDVVQEPVFSEESSEHVTLAQEAAVEELEPTEQIPEPSAFSGELEHSDTTSQHITPTQEQPAEELGIIEEPFERAISVQGTGAEEMETIKGLSEPVPPVQDTDLGELEPAEEPIRSITPVEIDTAEESGPVEESFESTILVQASSEEGPEPTKELPRPVTAVQDDAAEALTFVEEPSEPIATIQDEVKQLEPAVDPIEQSVQGQDEPVGELDSAEERAGYNTPVQEAAVEQEEPENQPFPEPVSASEISAAIEAVQDEDPEQVASQFEQPSDDVALDMKFGNELQGFEREDGLPAVASHVEDQLDTFIEPTQESESLPAFDSTADAESEDGVDFINLPISQDLKSELDQIAQGPEIQAMHDTPPIQDSESSWESSAVIDTALSDSPRSGIIEDFEEDSPKQVEVQINNDLENDKQNDAEGAEDPEKITYGAQFDHSGISGADESREEVDSDSTSQEHALENTDSLPAPSTFAEEVFEPLVHDSSGIADSQERSPSPIPNLMTAIQQEPVGSLYSSPESVVELATEQERPLSDSTMEMFGEPPINVNGVPEHEPSDELRAIEAREPLEQDIQLVEDVDDLSHDAGEGSVEVVMPSPVTHSGGFAEEDSVGEKGLEVPTSSEELPLDKEPLQDFPTDAFDSSFDVVVPNVFPSEGEQTLATPREDTALVAELIAETEDSSGGEVSRTEEDAITEPIVNTNEISMRDPATEFFGNIVESEVATGLNTSHERTENTTGPAEFSESDDREVFDYQPGSPVESEAFHSALATPADFVFPIDHSDTESEATAAQSEASDSTHRLSLRLSADESLNGEISAAQLTGPALSDLDEGTEEVQEHATPMTLETGSQSSGEADTPDALLMETIQPHTMGLDSDALKSNSLEISAMPLEPEDQSDIPDSQETLDPSQGPKIEAREHSGEHVMAPSPSIVDIPSPITLEKEADFSMDTQDDTIEFNDKSQDVMPHDSKLTDTPAATNESHASEQISHPAHEKHDHETIQVKDETYLNSIVERTNEVELLSDQDSLDMAVPEPQEVSQSEVKNTEDIEGSEHMETRSGIVDAQIAHDNSSESDVDIELDPDADEESKPKAVVETPERLEMHDVQESSVLETAEDDRPEDLELQTDDTTSALNPNRASKDSGVELREQDDDLKAGDQEEHVAAKDRMAATTSPDYQILERSSPEPVDERLEAQLVRDSGVGLMDAWEADQTASPPRAQEESVSIAAPSADVPTSQGDFSSDGFDDDAPEITEVSSQPSPRPSTPVQQVRELSNNPLTPEATPNRGQIDKLGGGDAEREIPIDALERPSTPPNRTRAFPLLPPTPGSTPRELVQPKSVSMASEEHHAWAEQHTSNLATDELHVSVAIAEEVLKELPSPKAPVVLAKIALEPEPERGRRRTRDWTQDAAKVTLIASQDEAAEPSASEAAPALPPRKAKGSNHGIQGYQMPGEIDVNDVPPPNGPPPAGSASRVPARSVSRVAARSASRPPAYQRQDEMRMPQPPVPAVQLSANAAPYQPREAPKKYPAPSQPVAGVSGFNIPPPPEPAYTDGRTSRAPSKSRSKSRGRRQGGRNQSRHQSRPRRHPWDAPPVIERAFHAAAVGVMQGFSAPMDLYRTVRDVYYPPPGRPDIVKAYEVRARLPVRIFFPSHHDGFSQALLPTLFTIHGGAFTIGSAADDDLWNRNFADSFSTLVVALNYAKAPWAGFPCPLLDVEALYHAVMNDESIPIDKNRTALAGFDAGANLALTLAQLPSVKTGVSPNAPGYPYPQQIPYPAPKAAISICGILDFAIPSGAKARTRPYKRQLKGIRGWGAGLDWMMRILPSSAWSYIPYGHDVMDPLLSPFYARRADLPPHLFVVGAELDCLAHESWRAACIWAGRPVPTSNMLVGRRNPSRWRGGLDDGAGENALKFAWEESGNGRGGEGSTRWLLVPDVVHGFDCAGWRAQYMWADEEGRVDSEMKTFAYQRELATWLWGTVWREEIRPWR